MVHICTQSLILLTLNFYPLDSLCPPEGWSPKISQSNQPSAKGLTISYMFDGFNKLVEKD